MMPYEEFLQSKRIKVVSSGFEVSKEDINPKLFDFQVDITKWALAKGKAAIFCGCGLGKTPMQLEWAHHVHEHTGGDVLILAPLAVAEQTKREGEKFDVLVHLCRSQEDIKPGINITNYEMLHKFDPGHFVGIVLDESSILKSFEGKVRTQIIDSFQSTPFKLACTATPAPNDHMELGNHAEFLGVMSRTEMLSCFFVHDGGDTSKWRLKGHAVKPFWEWMASWSVMMTSPSDLGYDGSRFVLPELRLHEIVVDKTGYYVKEAQTLQDRRGARRDSIVDRVGCAAQIANQDDNSCLIWCDLNVESEALTKAINGAVEIRGSHDPDYKAVTMEKFSKSEIKKLVTKPSIAGHGVNWQHCSKAIFVGLSDSFEQYYQAVRRCWRFGQDKPVDVYLITSEKEGAVVKNIKRKEKEFEGMLRGMISATQELTANNIRCTERLTDDYKVACDGGPGWEMRLGDNVEAIKTLEDGSVHFICYSPPFSSLYTYSNSPRDMGNCKTDDEFFEHFAFLSSELFRVLMPGRLMAVHCMNLPTTKQRDGYIGIRDFRGDLIRIFQNAGFIYHSEVCIWKDPVTAMQRTKALGLLHKQLKKDSCMSRQGIPDYLVVMQKPGDNPERVTHTNESFPVSIWQRWASPTWEDINPSDTLQRTSAREDEDERHIAPLQLEVIRRALILWTNIGDLILDPFAGIGSTGFEAIKNGRKFIGLELKESYYNQACANLKRAVFESTKPAQVGLAAFEVPNETQA
jgi:DNA modification methylase